VEIVVVWRVHAISSFFGGLVARLITTASASAKRHIKISLCDIKERRDDRQVDLYAIKQ
jgi:hypothetical protein